MLYSHYPINDQSGYLSTTTYFAVSNQQGK